MNWKDEAKKVLVTAPDPVEYNYQGLLDIVIPVYNDKRGLQETLFSLNIKNRYHIVVVDDCSTTDTYDDVIEFFKQFHDIELTKTSSNGGPAVAKNTGVKLCKNKYITFIDAGDTIVNVDIITQIEKIMEENPHGEFLSCGHYEEGCDASLRYIPPEHNRWMGKVYRKTFFDKSKLAFNEEMSFCNDDIGMNMLARMIATEEKILHYDEPFVIWHNNENSVTRKNEYTKYFKESSMGTAKSAIYALTEGKKRFVHPRKMKELSCSVMCALYYNYLATLNYRPEYLDEVIEASKYFYQNGFLQFPIDMEMLVDIYNITTVNKLQNEDWEPSLLRLPQISFLDFLSLLDRK